MLYKFPKLFNVIIAYRLGCSFIPDNRKYEVEIGMDHFIVFDARLAGSA
jgi:hypothetical protein